MKVELKRLVLRLHEMLFSLHGSCQFLATPTAKAFLEKLRATNPHLDIPMSPGPLSWFLAEVAWAQR